MGRREPDGALWHPAYPPDADGAGFRHPGPLTACTEPECQDLLFTPAQPTEG